MGILRKCLEDAIDLDSSRVEIEYRNGRELITAFVNCVGVGIGSVESSRSGELFRELEELKKAKRLESRGKSCRLGFSEYDSFGETVHIINIVGARTTAPDAGQRRRRR